MKEYEKILQKLEGFIRKYYLNELIKGSLLFIGIGLLYFLLLLLIEYFFWLGTGGRTVLFWLFISVELFLAIRFVAIPIAKLFKFRKGISLEYASKLIGAHFPQVGDKLINLLQLASDTHKSELLLSSIAQKSALLHPIPFSFAVDLKKGFSYARYTLIPIFIGLLFWLSGFLPDIRYSYQRMVNYSTAYEPPAPFAFVVTNKSLKAVEGVPFTIEVEVIGEVLPEEAMVHIGEGEQTYFLKKKSVTNYEFTVERPKEDLSFYFTANNVFSKPYVLNVAPVPVLLDFQMSLDFPSHTGRPDEVIKGTGNAVIPEGTKVEWTLKTRQADKVDWINQDTIYPFEKSLNVFNFSQRVFKDLSYEISTSNEEVPNYENLGYTIRVIKDQYPEIRVKAVLDSSNFEHVHLEGQLSDDYGLSSLRLIYYAMEQPENQQQLSLPINASTFDQFIFDFPANLPLLAGIPYEYFFEVTDNDIVHGGKSSKSAHFTYRVKTKEEKRQEQLKNQKEALKDLDRALDQMKESKNILEELAKESKEQRSRDYNEQKKLENYLERQIEQQAIMKRFTQDIDKSLEEFQQTHEALDEEYQKLLEERLQRQQLEIEKNERLMEELQKIADKINQEQLGEKLEELAKQQRNDQRNLEQLLELTKRFYVAEKANQLSDKLQDLGEKQEKLSDKNGVENSLEKQKQLSEEFDKILEELDQLSKDNHELRKPMNIARDERRENEVDQHQEKASNKLEERDKTLNINKKSSSTNEDTKNPPSQEKPSDSITREKENSSSSPNSSEENSVSQKQEGQARQEQKQAGQKMRQMGKQMQSEMSAGMQQSIAEDATALRQILDNLLLFSLEQEDVMERFQTMENSSPTFAKDLKHQYELRETFEHVDDSLFALSLRIPQITEKVNQEISNVYYNLDKSLEQFADNRVYQGVTNQRYGLTAANNLADFLSNTLDNMMNMMSASGSGSSEGGMQLPDIIKSQQEINEKMGEGMNNSNPNGTKENGNQQGGKNPGDKGNGQPGEGNTSSGNSQGEAESERLFEIYKQQQLLRMALERQLKDQMGLDGSKGGAERLLKEMEGIEQMLLERGFDPQTFQRMRGLEHQLLKLDQAAFQQGKDNQRESRSNKQEFENSVQTDLPDISKYFRQSEILNRQALPLREIYREKVRAYFRQNDRDSL